MQKQEKKEKSNKNKNKNDLTMQSAFNRPYS